MFYRPAKQEAQHPDELVLGPSTLTAAALVVVEAMMMKIRNESTKIAAALVARHRVVKVPLFTASTSSRSIMAL